MATLNSFFQLNETIPTNSNFLDSVFQKNISLQQGDYVFGSDGLSFYLLATLLKQVRTDCDENLRRGPGW